MARWRLTAPHYLNCPGTEWEFVETDTGTGKQIRNRHMVPRYLDPKDPSDHNRPGEITVCHSGKGISRDLEFIGPPTPEMEPLDDEAQKISDADRHKWSMYGSGPGGLGYAEGMLADFQKQLSQAMATAGPLPQMNVTMNAEIAELKEQMAELMKQNAELMRKTGTRRA
jgi:hypothetical protein